MGGGSREHGQLWKAYFASVGFTGVLSCWAVQGARNSAILRELGLPNSYLSFAWLAGPISGAFTQLIVGGASDRCTSPYGRRRPFIVAGSLLTVLGLALFSNAAKFGIFLGDSVASHQHTWGLTIAIIAFWLLDASINVLQAPMRALLSDTVRPEYQSMGNALFSFHGGIGKLIGYAFSAACVLPFPGLSSIGSSPQAIYGLAAIVTVFTTGLSVLGADEEPLSPDRVAARGGDTGGFREELEATVTVLQKLPVAFWVACITNFLAVFGRFAAAIYSSTWMGEVIFGGDPALENVEGAACKDLGKYEQGVTLANAALMVAAILTILWSLLLPLLMRLMRGMYLLGIHLVLFAALLGGITLLEEGQTTWAFYLIAGFGIPKAGLDVLTWNVVTNSCSTDPVLQVETGRITTIFNLTGCAADISMALLCTPLIAEFGTPSAFSLAAIFVLVSAAICFIWSDDYHHPERETYRPIVLADDGRDFTFDNQIESEGGIDLRTIPPVLERKASLRRKSSAGAQGFSEESQFFGSSSLRSVKSNYDSLSDSAFFFHNQI